MTTTHAGEPIEEPEEAAEGEGDDMEGGQGGRQGASPHEAATLLLQHLQVGC